MPPKIDSAVERGDWVPIYLGNRYGVARQLKDALRTEERCTVRYFFLWEAQAECRKRNADKSVDRG